MAITKLISPSTPNPVTKDAGGDWDKAMAQLTAVKKLLSGEQMILTQWTNTTTAPALAEGSYLQHMGAIYVVDTEDYLLPALSSDGTYYIKLTVSGETLVPTFTTDLTGFSWSAQHNGLYNASDEQILHYQVVKNASAIEKYKMLNPYQVDDFAVVNYLGRYHGRELHVTGAASIGGNATIGGTLGVTGAISGASVDTGDGAMTFDQGVKTTDYVEFERITAPRRAVFTAGNPIVNVTDGSLYTQLIGFVPLDSPQKLVSGWFKYTNSGSWQVVNLVQRGSGADTVELIGNNNGVHKYFVLPKDGTTTCTAQIYIG